MGNNSELIIYTTEDGLTKVDVTFENDTVWLTQDQMAELFQKSKSTINEHISNIYEDGELKKDSTMRKFGNPEFSTTMTQRLIYITGECQQKPIVYMRSVCTFL